MHYIIEQLIQFDPEQRLLKNFSTDKELKLYTPASIILLNLLNDPGRVFTYSELINLAWRRDEQSVSISTLHQNILNIRSALKKLGLDQNLIISIPKEGFQLCTKTKFAKTTLEVKTNKYNKKSIFFVCFFICLSTIPFFIEKATRYSLFAFERYYIDTKTVIGRCKIYVNSDSPTRNVKSFMSNDTFFDCKEKMRAYVTFYQKDNYSIFLCKDRLPLGMSKTCINKIVNR